MKKFIAFVLCVCACCGVWAKIDRKALVERHNVTITESMKDSPAQVGNGNFSFNVDISGMQSFGISNFPIHAHWGWHSVPPPEDPENFGGAVWKDFGGKERRYMNLPNPEQPELSSWLASNPHKLNFGRVGIEFKKADGSVVDLPDLQNAVQKLDLYRGVIESKYDIEGVPVKVTTTCHPEFDMFAVKIESPLVKEGRVKIFWNVTDLGKGKTAEITESSDNGATVANILDGTKYFMNVAWNTPAKFYPINPNGNGFYLEPQSGTLEFVCEYSPDSADSKKLPSFKKTLAASAKMWKNFWKSGAAVDFSGSTDPRANELERRVVLSQYLMRATEAGDWPPPESGLLFDGAWHGRYHFEMIWWHAYHYALWDRWDLMSKSIDVYRKFLSTSIERAKGEGFKGARWPKCTADFDRDWPHPIHATLIWQQPHPIYFAETEYRMNPTKETLEKWKDIVFESAEFMADFPVFRKDDGKYHIEPPVCLVSENTDIHNTFDPAYELSYWRYGLGVALEWQKRLGLEENKKWREVLDNLAPLPVEDGVYVTYKGIPEMWTRFNFEHPGLIGTYGMLRGDGVDIPTFKNTLEKVSQVWRFDRTWGWDFPMLAMAAARTGEYELAMDFLLTKAPGFQFDAHGLASGGPWPYFPSNGGLLSAVAMMAGGWDGAPEPDKNSLWFPRNGMWKVKAEGFRKHQ